MSTTMKCECWSSTYYYNIYFDNTPLFFYFLFGNNLLSKEAKTIFVKYILKNNNAFQIIYKYCLY